MQDTTYAAYEAAHQATAAVTAAPEFASQAASYAAADLGFLAATQEAAAQSVATAGELVKSSGEFAMTAGEAAVIAAEAAGAAVMATAVIALPVIVGGIGLAGLGGAAYYAWNKKGWTLAGMKASFKKAQAEATTPGQWPQWEGHNVDAIWNDDQLLEEATRPEPSADELIDWDALALECNA